MRSMQQQLGNLGTISAFACRHRETKKNLCRGGRSQDLPDNDCQPFQSVKIINVHYFTQRSHKYYFQTLQSLHLTKKKYYFKLLINFVPQVFSIHNPLFLPKYAFCSSQNLLSRTYKENVLKSMLNCNKCVSKIHTPLKQIPKYLCCMLPEMQKLKHLAAERTVGPVALIVQCDMYPHSCNKLSFSHIYAEIRVCLIFQK